MNDRLSNGAIVQNLSQGDRPSEGMTVPVRRWFGIFHCWDFLSSDVVEGKADWKTNSRHPLNATTLYGRWKRPDQLIGVRFETKKWGQTSYAMIDIDRGSLYHPCVNEVKLQAILRSLENIGLCRFIPVRSSESEGLHLYFPLPKRLSCTGLAIAVQQTLISNGFEISQGQLEIFPNVRSSWNTLYQGHRLPLQTGSCVLDDSWQPLHQSIERLIHAWELAASGQDIETLKHAVAARWHKKRYQSEDFEEWKLRLETTFKEGWTDTGQTNQIIKNLCTYARVFERLTWDAVEQWVLLNAPQLTGYKQFCRHQRTIRRRIRDWVKTNRESNRYRPAGDISQRRQRKAPTNEERKKEALRRIQEAIAAIQKELGALPSGVKNRQTLICQKAGCSAKTLYLYKELWHPNFEGKGCVTPYSERVSTVLDESHKIQQSASGCVTTDAASVSAIAKEFLNNSNKPETLLRQGFTHPLLLSGNSQEESNRTHEASSKALQLKPNDLVRWKAYGDIFKVKRVNSNGTVWANRLNCPVMLVDAILSVDELELIQS